jgi:hypothetical protein
MARIIRIGMTTEEAKYLLDCCKAMERCEIDSAIDFPENAEIFKKAEKFWIRIQNELKEAGVK